MSNDQMIIAAWLILIILASAVVGGITWAWQAFWDAYDKKWRHIPPTRGFARSGGQHAPRAQRGSQTRGHV